MTPRDQKADSATRAPRPELPPLPPRMTRLKLDHRGYPVPWFVPWLDDNNERCQPGEGRAEFRMFDEKRLIEALKYEQCWICGGQLGRYKAFVIGPMCIVNRINAEPPSHLECADYAGRACPFLARPHMARRGNEDLPNGDMAGIGIMRNPGVAVVWVIKGGFPIKTDPNGKLLFQLPDPNEVRFYAEGRLARREEIVASFDSGLPLLLEVCQDASEREEVYRRALEAQKLLPAA